MSGKRSILKTLFIWASLLTGCSFAPNYACLTIPCTNSLTIKLTGQTVEAFSLSIKARNQTEEVFSCPNANPLQPFDEKKPHANYSCTKDMVVIPRFIQEEIEVTYRAGDKQVTRTLNPVYIDKLPTQDLRCGKCLDGQTELAL